MVNIALVFAKLVVASEWIGNTAIAASNVAWEQAAVQVNCFNVTL